MDFFDSHAHLTDPRVYGDIDAIVHRSQVAGVGSIMNICTDAETLAKGLQLSKRYPWIYIAAATTPHDVEKEGEQLFSLMEHHARSGDLAAVGETGLDYYYEHSAVDIQKHFLERYLRLALKCSLPIIIHCREAFSDLFGILDAEYKNGPGVLHCFTGTVAEAEQVLERGLYLSISGIVTFKKSEQLCEVAKRIPLERLLIETDTPYLAPQSHRGKTNEPAFLTEVAEKIASLKNISVEEVASITTDNANRFFNVSS